MADKDFVQLKRLNTQGISISIRGISPLIQHQWSEKAKAEMRDKHAGKKTKTREVRNIDAEVDSAMYKTRDGRPAIPLLALKAAFIAAAHKDLGIEKTLVRKALFIKDPDFPGGMIPLNTPGYQQREDYVRVGMGGTDLRYRPQFNEWSAGFDIEYDADLLQPSDIVNLINRAGFGVGICEWRPEKGGDFGRFEVYSE